MVPATELQAGRWYKTIIKKSSKYVKVLHNLLFKRGIEKNLMLKSDKCLILDSGTFTTKPKTIVNGHKGGKIYISTNKAFNKPSHYHLSKEMPSTIAFSGIKLFLGCFKSWRGVNPHHTAETRDQYYQQCYCLKYYKTNNADTKNY